MSGKVPKFHVVEGWERLPPDMIHLDVCGVAVDSRNRPFMLGRGDGRVLVYEPDGTFVTSWGEDVFSSRIHGICIGPDDSVYTVDIGDHTVREFTPKGNNS